MNDKQIIECILKVIGLIGMVVGLEMIVFQFHASPVISGIETGIRL